ncbi:acyl-CoA N-acyltransferase [Melanomma pulvis-pyrius CBS 109.77]|uniref:Acyl-CoA N-acyltransferase n=1 Tax=Melanomma pulvis-pyrius CBS 109.77 TaxID=1314802 RepID=A0A6A6XUM6_9PLEO|nr:acyl-CoA N-acyltransferase [Melanomma pulvis-pyrius CBS 109.77]
MSSDYVLSKALLSDAEAIASLFALSWTSPFTQLQFGNVDPSSLAASMAPRIKQHMEKPGINFIVARHPQTQKVVAVAQWNLPMNNDEEKGKRVETAAEKEERQQFEDEAYRKRLPETSNKDLILEFTAGLRSLKEELLQGRYHYLLENLATHPEYRGKGLASKLVAWPFPQADEGGIVIYLETASDNPAMGLYRKLGFQEKGRRTIEDLSRYGGEGSHTHVAFIRYPNTSV